VPDPHHCRIHGPTPLRGAELEVPDLRAGASLILAAFIWAQRRLHRAQRWPALSVSPKSAARS